MQWQRIDVSTLATSNPYIAAVLKVAIDNHREYQWDLKELPNHDTAKAISSRGAGTALEALAAVIRIELDVPHEDARLAAKSHVWNVCGPPNSPRGLEAWAAPTTP